MRSEPGMRSRAAWLRWSTCCCEGSQTNLRRSWMHRKLMKSLAIAAILPLIALLCAQTPPPDGAVSRELTKQTVEQLASSMKSDYVFPDLANKVDTMLRDRLKKGEYDKVSSGQEL